MNKVIVVAVCVLCLTGILSGCGKTDSTQQETTTIKSEVSADRSDSEEKKEIAEKSNDLESDMPWRQFLKDYEAWVDTYVEFMEKYRDNPTDVSLISDYTKFVQQTAEWAQEAEKYQSDLEVASPEILGEYVEKLGRITKKIVEIAY